MLKKICLFIARRVRIEYIPVNRTSQETVRLIHAEVAKAARDVAHREEYQAAMRQVLAIFADAMRPLETRLAEGMSALLPAVRDVRITMPRMTDPLSVRDLDIIVDDGIPTSLATKGDGVQSLATIALIKSLARRESEATYILAVEEPESHLHPGAVRALKADLEEIARDDQVIITTHSPILVDRVDPTANILVQQNSAGPAKRLEEVRDSLGVELPDNMTSAELVVLTEGQWDCQVLEHVLRRRSVFLENAIQTGRLVFRDAEGANNLQYQMRLYRESIAAYMLSWMLTRLGVRRLISL